MYLAPAAFAPGRGLLVNARGMDTRARLSQFGSHFGGPESHTHASRANHSCEMRHDGQNVRLKKTGIEQTKDPSETATKVAMGLGRCHARARKSMRSQFS